MAYRWIKSPKATGLAAVAAHPRSSYMTNTEDDETYLCVYSEDRPGTSWRWMVIRSSGNLRSKKTYPSHDEARDAASAYWKVNRDELIRRRNEPRTNSES